MLKNLSADHAAELDGKDLKILDALQTDGRITMAELGRKVGLSQPAISERVKRLEENGVILGYGARINPQSLGFAMTAYIRLRTTYEYVPSCIKRFAEIPNILEVHRVTGEDCFIIKVVVPKPSALEGIVNRIAVFGAVITSVVFRSEPVKPMGLDLLRTANES
ncbi:MAG: Lrp/AsnC family transcriptional regulator [Rhodomicrobium sp.]|nr:Lrp/AsnC family transcriptional regulator [Rhodomicrobium sp.]